MRTLVPLIDAPAPVKRSNYSINNPAAWLSNGEINWAAVRRRGPVHALCNSTFFRCVQLKTNIISSLPVRVVERATKREATEHPVHRLLQQPNSEQTGVEFWLMMLANYFTHGNCYAEKVIQRGRVTELLPMAACYTSVDRVQGQKIYRYSAMDPQEVLPARLVMHFRMFGEGDTTGMSPAMAAEQAILLAAAQQGMILEMADNGGVPKLVINLPPEKVLERLTQLEPGWSETDSKTIQAQIERARTRLALYLPAGYEGTPLAANFNDLQVQQTREFCKAEIAEILGVPLSKLAVVSKADSGKTAENDNLGFYQDELRPAIVNLEKRLEADLFTEDERGRYQIKFNVAAILRADLATQTEAFVKQWQSGRITTNEWRAYDDLPPFEDPRADTPNWPVNMTTEQTAGGQQLTNPNDGGVPARALFRNTLPEAKLRSLDARLNATRLAKPLYADAVGRIVRKEKAVVGKIVRAALGGRAGVQDIEAALKKLYSTDGELRQFIEKNIDKPVQFLFEAIRSSMESELGQKFDETELRKIVKRYIDIWARDYAHSSEYQIRDLIDTGGSETDILAAIEQRLTEWEQKRADKESADETNRGRNVFAKALYTLAGVSVLRWVLNGEGCELCQPLDGRTFSPQSIPECPLHRGCECSYTSAN
jgi:HK97 family phage portal protein